LNSDIAHAEALFDAGEFQAAEAIFRAVLTQDPKELVAAKGVARTLDSQRRFDDSYEAWEAASEIDPEDVICLISLGAAWLRRGDVEKSRQIFDAIRNFHPNYHSAHAMTLISMLYSDNVSDLEIIDAQKRWGQLQKPEPARVFDHYKGTKDPHRRLRIGFVSSDLYAHSVGYNLLPLYHGLDKDRFAVYSYAQVGADDAMTEKFRSLSEGWLDISAMTDEDVAHAIHRDAIDILVVTAGHMNENRPYIVRFRPAPVQINHHDIASSVMPEFDYWIGDPVLTPPQGVEYFSERVLRIPSFTIHPFPAEAPDPAPPPAILAGHVTFGSFNSPSKITPTVVKVWSSILREIPDARLILKYFDSYEERACKKRLRDLFEHHGIDQGRIDLLSGSKTRSQHLMTYSKVDIALDTFPFSGATTTFETLLMGVPVITLLGHRMPGRSSAATLKAAGLSVFVADDETDYINRAIEFAAKPERLAPLRQAIPTMLRNSPVCNTRSYIRNIQRVYRAVWRRWCAGQSVEGADNSHHTGV
jgi:protein O-GlcNAc transferase